MNLPDDEVKYIDIESKRELTREEVLDRTVGYRDFDGEQLTGQRISDYMLELEGIKRIRRNF